MIVLSAKDITKEYGTDCILRDISFHVEKGDRIGIVGANGAGKTTLLNILTGEEEPTSGSVTLAADTTMGYLKQKDTFDRSGTVLSAAEGLFEDLAVMEKDMLTLSRQAEEAASAGRKEEADRLIRRYDAMRENFAARGGYTYASEVRGVLSSMAFTQDMLNQSIDQLSGGEKTRLALACLLLEKPDLLLLDEPTNHLDIDTLKWLEQYVRGYRGTVIIVSHDRYFLDQTVNKIFEVEHHRLTRYSGSYRQYAEQKKARRIEEMRRYDAQQKEIKKQEEMIRRFKQRGTEKLAKRAASREKKLDSMERIRRPDSELSAMKIQFHETYESGRDVIQCEDLAKTFGYGSRAVPLFHGISLHARRGERICLVGPNGVGKTTLMKIIMGEIPPTDGYLKIGYNVAFGYYDQEQQNLHEDNTVLEEMADAYRLYSSTEMRSILGRFLFRDDDVFLRVGDLSGGEKARLSLVKLMLSGANVLLLDEPTNHLDIASKEVFEEALVQFPGTVIAVSHDRYFLNRVPTRILEMHADGMTEYLGQYDYYVEKKQAQAAAEAQSEAQGDSTSKETDESEENRKAAGKESTQAYRRRKKAEEAEERRRKRAKEKAESEIEATESEIADLEKQMQEEDVRNDYEQLETLSRQLDALNQKLMELYEAWLQ